MRKISRRKFIETGSLIGAAAALPTGRSSAGLLLKHLIPEEELIPGVFYWLRSTCNECPAGCGVRVRLINRNATKIEGNEQHPINHGGLCARGQSALQGLYSPGRIYSPLQRTASGTFEPVSWSAALEQAARLSESAGNGNIIIIGRHTTGAMSSLIDTLRSQTPNLRHLVCEPLEYSSVRAANQKSFGLDGIPVLDFEHAKLIISFGADFLETWLSPVAYAHGYALSRRPSENSMSRVIQFESHWSLTGANADERFAIPPGTDLLLAGAIAAEMLSDIPDVREEELQPWREALQQFTLEGAARATGVPAEAIGKLIAMLRSHRPSLVIAGGPTSRTKNAVVLQALVNLINYGAGNYGKTITFERFENSPTDSYQDMVRAVEEMETGQVSTLIVHDVSLEFSFPDPDRLQKAMQKVPLKIKLASVQHEDIEGYDLILPVLHWLETWDLVEPRTGLMCVRQPIIKPFTDARHPGQALANIVAALRGSNEQDSFDYEGFVQSEWEQVRRQAAPEQSFDSFWKQVLQEGGVWLQPVEREVRLAGNAADELQNLPAAAASVTTQITLLPIATVRYGDGRHTDKLWLNELPDPITTVAWDNPLLISPVRAKKWECNTGDIVQLSAGRTTLEVPVYVQEGTHDSVAALPLGAAGEHTQFHSYPNGNPLHALSGEIDLLSGALVWVGAPVQFQRVSKRSQLARIQGSFEQGTRGFAQAVYMNRIGAQAKEEEVPHAFGDLYPPYEYPVHKWGMVIDLSLCTGCGACAVACQAENNVFVVGKEQCLRGRKLSWLQVQRFSDKGKTVFLPMLCQHCGHAPCETVCPVYASVHNSEGLNVQVYNRCVGTRYCANNCPYKVRRFNWFTYKYPPPLEKQFNPFVSVRTRGTMEKCTFCIQRIRVQKEMAKDEKRALREGEIVPACAQSCPTGAIRFGDTKDPNSLVSRQAHDPRAYSILDHLNTQPSITYLMRVIHSDRIEAADTGTE